MPRRRPPRSLPPADRDLAEEVLYLHSLWRRGPPAPAPAHVLVPATAPIPSRSARRKAIKRKRRSLESGAPEPKDAGSEWPLAPSPPASPKAWPDASPKAWPDASASASSLAKPPPSPGSLAQREALRAAEEFFSNLFSDDDEGSESEGEDEAAAAGFFTRLFERDAALRGYYERGWEEGQFACMACSGRKARRGKARRFQGCVGLVQHARAATRYGRPGAHRALASVICRVLGWDIERLPSIVIDPRGTLGQALAALATANVQEAKKNDDTEENNGSSSDEDEEKEDVETGMKVSSTDGDKEAKELEISKESAEMEDVEEIGPLNCEDHSKNKVIGHETVQEEDAVNTGMEDSKSTDCEKEANELEGGKESAEKEVMEEIGPLNCEDISNEVHCNETVEDVNGNKDDSLSQDNNGEVHEQEIAKESAEQKNTKDLYLPSSKDSCTNEEHYKEAAVQEELSANESKKECAKTADDTKDTAATRLGNNSSMEEIFSENEEEHAVKTS